MTCCFAGRAKDGVVVIGDRRVSDEDEVFKLEQTKVNAIDKNTVIAFAGNRSFGQYFIEQMKSSSRPTRKNKSFRQTLNKAEKVLANIWERYGKSTDNEQIDKDRENNDATLETLIVGTDSTEGNKAVIIAVDSLLVPEESNLVDIVGAGYDIARGAFEVLWNEDLTVDKAWPIAVVIMKLVSRIHFSVGGLPDVYLVKDGLGQSKVSSDRVQKVYENTDIILSNILKKVSITVSEKVGF
jgi:20S proteasome alpha/beta subunit